MGYWDNVTPQSVANAQEGFKYWNGVKLEFFAYPRFNKECGIKEYPQEVLDDLIAGKKTAYIKEEGERRTVVFKDITDNQGENQQQKAEAAANQEETQ